MGDCSPQENFLLGHSMKNYIAQDGRNMYLSPGVGIYMEMPVLLQTQRFRISTSDVTHSW